MAVRPIIIATLFLAGCPLAKAEEKSASICNDASVIATLSDLHMKRLKALDLPRRFQNAATFTIDFEASKFYFDHSQAVAENTGLVQCRASSHLRLVLAVGGPRGTTLAENIEGDVEYRVRQSNGQLWVSLISD